MKPIETRGIITKGRKGCRVVEFQWAAIPEDTTLIKEEDWHNFFALEVDYVFDRTDWADVNSLSETKIEEVNE